MINLPVRVAPLAAIVLALAAGPAFAQTPPPVKPFSRDDARAILRDLRRITTPNGVEELRTVELNGLPQWISVRGKDRRNPILLFIHGGPASTEMPVSWAYQTPWEEYFTVVQWDQRAAGKTASGADHAAVGPTVNVEQMTRDGEALVAHLRERYGKARIIVMGHSWGTVIGLNLAIRRPEWLHAYVGMGQLIDWQENERAGYEFALREVTADGNVAALEELRSIAPYPPPDGETRFEQVVVQRKWVIHYGGLTKGRTDFAYDLNARKIAPEYTDPDLSPPVPDGDALVRLLPDLRKLDFGTVEAVRVPLFLFLGRRDYQTPSAVAAAWLDKVQAPQKSAIWFEHSAHMMQLEQPGRVLLSLVGEVRPIAAAAGDVAPPDRPGVD